MRNYKEKYFKLKEMIEDYLIKSKEYKKISFPKFVDDLYELYAEKPNDNDQLNEKGGGK